MGGSSTSCLHDEDLPCAARPRNPAEPRVRHPEVSALPQHPLCALSLQNKGATGGFSLVCQQFDNKGSTFTGSAHPLSKEGR